MHKKGNINSTEELEAEKVILWNSGWTFWIITAILDFVIWTGEEMNTAVCVSYICIYIYICWRQKKYKFMSYVKNA